MILLLVIFCMVSLSSGQSCCMPVKWSGIEGFILETVPNGHITPLITEAKYYLSVDYERQLVSAVGTVATNGKQSEVKTLIDYSHMKQYNVVDGNCTVTAPDPFLGRCIPRNATINRQGFVGLDDDAMNVTQYHFSIQTLVLYLTVTDRCIPMANTYFGQTPDSFVISNAVYTAIVESIQNETLLNIPNECTGRHSLPHLTLVHLCLVISLRDAPPLKGSNLVDLLGKDLKRVMSSLPLMDAFVHRMRDANILQTGILNKTVLNRMEVERLETTVEKRRSGFGNINDAAKACPQL